MALQKQFTNEQGIVTNYHRVSGVTLQDMVLTCMLDSYVSKEYRAAEQPATTQMFRFDILVEEEESMGIRALCYSKIKQEELWKDSTDC